eukprot:CAMPEP_0196584786 /NCGR_PEP_ID=MMETSP1081-20130531/48461_1 /TAXON_ID=36882 /ORGANISM="Pyramimonas amylifera, Strain CCMP720" /LENGTH=139 /DNA_ID=CAMNT_0041906129 /DNA_START=166 /DNA_END=585 /DNA_ORIENTATION=-
MSEDSSSGIVFGTSDTGAGSSRMAQTDSEDLLEKNRAMLIFFGLVEQIQQALKKGAREDQTRSTVQEEGAPEDPWVIHMQKRLMDVPAMLVLSEHLLSSLQEMEEATDLQEMFDVMEVLPDVLSGGCSSCEEFVNEAKK